MSNAETTTVTKSLRVTVQAWERVKERKSRTGKDMQRWVSDLILDSMEKEEMLTRIAPNMSLQSKSPTSLLIWDAKLGRTAEIVPKDGEMECYLCEKRDCPHIDFAKMLPELGHLNLIRKTKK